NGHTERHLLLQLYSPEENFVDDSLVVARFVQNVADIVEELRTSLQQLLASVKSAALFVGDAEVDDVAAKREVAPLQLDHRHRLGDPQRSEEHTSELQ